MHFVQYQSVFNVLNIRVGEVLGALWSPRLQSMQDYHECMYAVGTTYMYLLQYLSSAVIAVGRRNWSVCHTRMVQIMNSATWGVPTITAMKYQMNMVNVSMWKLWYSYSYSILWSFFSSSTVGSVRLHRSEFLPTWFTSTFHSSLFQH